VSPRLCTAFVLRYRHDAFTGEALNVAVLLVDSQEHRLCFRRAHGLGRITGAFPDADARDLNRALGALDAAAERLSGNLMFGGWEDPKAVAQQIVPIEESSLCWSTPIKVQTSALETTADMLAKRLLERYVKRPREHRDDDDVSDSFRNAARRVNFSQHLEKKVIHDGSASIEFEHAFKNGIWHCVMPLSFDLASRDTILSKASTAAGRLLSIRDSEEQFCVYFLVGRPQIRELITDLGAAEQILSRAPKQSGIIFEEQSEALLQQFLQQLPAGSQ
jgi:hypothetical protein